MIDDGDDRRPDSLTWFRVVVCLALAASVVITWPVWNVRAAPPLLPLAPLPQLSLGLPLLAACLVTVIAPRPGALLVTAIVAAGMVADQTRMQPEFFSLPILLWGTLPLQSGRLIARAHLIALWFFAGAHKLLSADYLADAGPRLLLALPLPLPADVVPIAVVGIALFEIGTAALAVIPETRRCAAWLALVLHAGVLFAFSPMAQMRNPAVWPWNAALALSGFALIAPWRTRLTSDLLAVPLPVSVTSAAILIAPLGFYAGVVDAYPAHHLYSAATARATVYCPAGCHPEQDVNATWYAFNVPLPPQPRLYRATFAATCAPGDVLRISGQRPPFWEQPQSVAPFLCPSGSLPAAHP